MSVSKMEKLTAILPRSDADTLLRKLMRMRVISLLKTEVDGTEPLDTTKKITESAARAARVNAALPILTKCSRRKKKLFAPLTPCDFREFQQSDDLPRANKTVEETEKIMQTIGEIDTELVTQEALMKSLLPYLDFPHPLNGEATKVTRFLLGCMPSGTKAEALTALADEVGFVITILLSDTTGVYVSALYHLDTEEKVLQALSTKGFVRASFPITGDKATAIYDEAAARKKKLIDTRERLHARLDVLSDNLTELEILSDMEQTTCLAETHKQNLATTTRCAILTGWCPVQAKERVIKTLEAFGAAYEFEPPAEEDDVPILLKNNAFARNFEWVLGMYAYPKYGRFDPTFIMSIFYFIIFGLMFADAGYGLVLTLACFGAVRLLPLRDGMKRFMLMFGYCGISCIIFGVLFGSYFGNFPLAFMEYMLGYSAAQLPNLALVPTLAANVAVWFDPLQNPMGFLLVSLGIGAVHLLAGMAVKAFILCRDKKPLDALFDIGSYWLLFAGIALLFIHRTTGILLTVGGILAIIATQGRHKKGVAGKIIGGFGGIYGLINYASDLLSYSRILALGLAAGVIGQVVNIVATMKGASFIGFLLMIVVFVIGHLLNLVINVLGTFVHTSRLQYIEFFGKFYEEGGTPFRPITAADKYTEDVSAESEAPTQ